MAFEKPVHKPAGLKAGADLSSAQFLAVKISGDLQVVLAGAGELAYGILQNKPSQNEAAEMIRLGQSKAVYGASVTAGQELMADASGKLVPWSVGNRVVAIALEGGSTDEIRSVDVLPSVNA